jgi:hypothetical protein
MLDEVFKILSAVDSETDALPVGEARKSWSSHALAGEDAKILNAEALYREMVANACRKLLEALKNDERLLVVRVTTSLDQA